MPMMCPIMDVDVNLLDNNFAYDYREGDRVLYLSVNNNKKKHGCPNGYNIHLVRELKET